MNMLRCIFAFLIFFLSLITCPSYSQRHSNSHQFPPRSERIIDKHFKGSKIENYRGEYRVRKDYGRSEVIFKSSGHPRYISVRDGVSREFIPGRILESLIDIYGVYFIIRSFEEIKIKPGSEKIIYRVKLLGGAELYYTKRYRLIKPRSTF